MNARHVLDIMTAFLSVSLLSGCAFSTARVDLAYRPVASARTPLAEAPPAKVVLRVQDGRDLADPNRLGDKKNGLNQVTAGVVSKSDVVGVVRDALQRELENSGHKVLTGDAGEVGTTFTVVLKEFWCETRARTWDVEGIVRLNADVSVTGADGNVLAKRTLSTNYRQTYGMFLDRDFEELLNAALADFVRQFALDSRLAGALRPNPTIAAEPL